MIKRITIYLFSFMAFFMAIQLVGFSYTASKSLSQTPQENLQEEEVHKYCEASQLIEETLKYPNLNIWGNKNAWPEQFLKDSRTLEPNTPPPRFLRV